jgi:hypothetical protein
VASASSSTSAVGMVACSHRFWGRYPKMQGVLFDLENVVAGAGPGIAAAGIANRCRIEAGDFFASVPAGGDAYILKHVIHDWDDNRAVAILCRVRAALDAKPDARVILLESVLMPGNRPDPAKFADLTMLLSVGGRERSLQELAHLLEGAGFVLTLTMTLRDVWVLEARQISATCT